MEALLIYIRERMRMFNKKQNKIVIFMMLIILLSQVFVVSNANNESESTSLYLYFRSESGEPIMNTEVTQEYVSSNGHYSNGMMHRDDWFHIGSRGESVFEYVVVANNGGATIYYKPFRIRFEDGAHYDESGNALTDGDHFVLTVDKSPQRVQESAKIEETKIFTEESAQSTNKEYGFDNPYVIQLNKDVADEDFKMSMPVSIKEGDFAPRVEIVDHKLLIYPRANSTFSIRISSIGDDTYGQSDWIHITIKDNAFFNTQTDEPLTQRSLLLKEGKYIHLVTDETYINIPKSDARLGKVEGGSETFLLEGIFIKRNGKIYRTDPLDDGKYSVRIYRTNILGDVEIYLDYFTIKNGALTTTKSEVVDDVKEDQVTIHIYRFDEKASSYELFPTLFVKDRSGNEVYYTRTMGSKHTINELGNGTYTIEGELKVAGPTTYDPIEQKFEVRSGEVTGGSDVYVFFENEDYKDGEGLYVTTDKLLPEYAITYLVENNATGAIEIKKAGDRSNYVDLSELNDGIYNVCAFDLKISGIVSTPWLKVKKNGGKCSVLSSENAIDSRLVFISDDPSKTSFKSPTNKDYTLRIKNLMNTSKTFLDVNASNGDMLAIQTMSKVGVINGYDGDLFKPENSVTRSEFASMVLTAFNLKDHGQVSFKDVNNEWYRQAVLAVASNGILSGYEGYANPNGKITREQLAVMLMKLYDKYSEHSYLTQSYDHITDYDQISSWALTSVEGTIQLDLLPLDESISFEPKREATRSEVASALYRLIKYLELLP